MCSASLSTETSIDVLNLSRRAYNCLRRAGVDTVQQVTIMSDDELLALQRLGPTVLSEIHEKLASYLDPDLPPDDLRQLASLGPWAEWVVANHPKAPMDLLEQLAGSPDPQVRGFVARNPNTPEILLAKLAEDGVAEVQWAVTQRRQMYSRN